MEFKYNEEHIAHYLWIVGGSCLLAFGNVGNILSLLVINRKNKQRNSAEIYLSALAVCDICVLNVALLRQVVREAFGIDIRSIHGSVCKIQVFLTYFFSYLASWILVAISIERGIGVWKPFVAKKLFTVRFACVVLVTEIVALLCLNCHFLYGFEIKTTPARKNVADSRLKYTCTNNPNDKTYKHFWIFVWPWIDGMMIFVIPFVILLVCNIAILINIRRSRMFRQQTNEISTRRATSQTRLSVMIVILSATFFVLLAPINTFVAVRYYLWPSGIRDRHLYAVNILIWASVNVLTYTNNAINFLLYVLWGNKFRQKAKMLLCGCRNGQRQKTHDISTRTQVELQAGSRKTNNVEARQTER